MFKFGQAGKPAETTGKRLSRIDSRVAAALRLGDTTGGNGCATHPRLQAGEAAERNAVAAAAHGRMVVAANCYCGFVKCFAVRAYSAAGRGREAVIRDGWLRRHLL